MNIHDPQLLQEVRACASLPKVAIEYWLSWLLAHDFEVSNAQEVTEWMEDVENELGETFAYMLPEGWQHNG